MDENLPSHAQKAMDMNSGHRGISSFVGSENSEVFRYDNAETIKDHIRSLIDRDGSKRVICGIENLKLAPASGTLRAGQIIYGTVPAERPLQLTEYPTIGHLANLIAPFLATGQHRPFAYLHVAVYAGRYEDQDYVIQNGGKSSFCDTLSMIDAVPMEKAFHKDAKFFIISPPKDSKYKSTRHLVLQRALACLGTWFNYNLRAVSCETFAMTLLKMQPMFLSDTIQPAVLKSFFWDIRPECVKRALDERKYKKFHEALVQKMIAYQADVNLTLDYYFNNKVDEKLKKPTTARDPDKLNSSSNNPWWRDTVDMGSDYNSFADAVKNQDCEKCEELINKGLNIHFRLRNETKTPIDYAHGKGFTEVVKLLQQYGAELEKENQD